MPFIANILPMRKEEFFCYEDENSLKLSFPNGISPKRLPEIVRRVQKGSYGGPGWNRTTI